MVTVPVTPAVLCVTCVPSILAMFLKSIVKLAIGLPVSFSSCVPCVAVIAYVYALPSCVCFVAAAPAMFTVGSALRSSLASKASVTVEPSAAHAL